MQVGLRLAHRAHFNVNVAPFVWDDFAKREGPTSNVLALLSTHPPSSERKKALQRELVAMFAG
jgi:Zn-dependent protease with chaperone function